MSGNNTSQCETHPTDNHPSSEFIRVYASKHNWIITLIVYLNTRHNLDRWVVDDQYAKYLCEEAEVESIEDKDDPSIKIDCVFIYKVGEKVKVTIYDHIFYYKSKEAAYHDNKESFTGSFTDNRTDGKNSLTGVLKSWYYDGQKRSESNYKNSLRDGVQLQWHKNGKLLSECYYMSGIRHGSSKGWYPNGQRSFEYNYINDNFHGKQMGWFENGQPACENNYSYGVNSGIHQEWNETGKVTTFNKFI